MKLLGPVRRGFHRLWDFVFPVSPVSASHVQIAMHDSLAAFEGLLVASAISLLFWSLLTCTIFSFR